MEWVVGYQGRSVYTVICQHEVFVLLVVYLKKGDEGEV